MKIAKPTSTTVELVQVIAGVMAPLAAATMAVIMSVHIVYSGNLRSSLRSKAESLLIQLSLQMRPSVPIVATDISIVSLKDEDFTALPQANSPVRDATIDTYAAVLRRIAAANPRFVVMTWLTSAHPVTGENFASVVSAVRETQLNDKFLLSLPYINDGNIPALLGRILPIADGDDCIYEINRICSYPDLWDEWIIKKLAKVFWQPREKWHVSANLPYINSYILNFPQASGMQRLSFSEILSGSPLAPGRVYFIGNDVTQDLRFRNSKYVLQRTYSFEALPSTRQNLAQDGLPFHEFWARLTQMFEARATVAIVPNTLERALVAIYLLGLGTVMFRLGMVWAFAILLINMLVLPIMNGFALRYAGIYLPQFELLFGGTVLCAVGMMITVSWSNYQRFRTAAAAQHHRDVADIKSNFVSLVSHNLNTTVAKLAGLMDIFKNSSIFSAQTSLIDACNLSVGELFVCVRNVLASLALREGQATGSLVTLRRVVDEFKLSYGGMMRRMAIDYELEVAGEDADSDHVIHSSEVPADAHFLVNVRILHQCLASLLSVTNAFRAQGCLLNLSLINAQDSGTGASHIRVHAKYFLPRDPTSLAQSLQNSHRVMVTDGFVRLTLGFIDGVLAASQGSMTAVQSGDHVVVNLAIAVTEKRY